MCDVVLKAWVSWCVWFFLPSVTERKNHPILTYLWRVFEIMEIKSDFFGSKNVTFTRKIGTFHEKLKFLKKMRFAQEKWSVLNEKWDFLNENSDQIEAFEGWNPIFVDKLCEHNKKNVSFNCGTWNFFIVNKNSTRNMSIIWRNRSKNRVVFLSFVNIKILNCFTRQQNVWPQWMTPKKQQQLCTPFVKWKRERERENYTIVRSNRIECFCCYCCWPEPMLKSWSI